MNIDSSLVNSKQKLHTCGCFRYIVAMSETPGLNKIARILLSIQISILGLAIMRFGTLSLSGDMVFLGILIVALGVISAGVALELREIDRHCMTDRSTHYKYVEL